MAERRTVDAVVEGSIPFIHPKKTGPEKTPGLFYCDLDCASVARFSAFVLARICCRR